MTLMPVKVSKSLTIGSIAISALLLAGCKPGMINDRPKGPDAPHLSIIFDGNGKLVTKGKDGRDLPKESQLSQMEAESLIRDAKEKARQTGGEKGLQDTQTMSVWRIIGSHYYIYRIGNRYYKIPLPH